MRTNSQAANRLSAVFYTVTAVVSLAGATTAAVGWLGWPVLPAAFAVGVVELGGIALAVRADLRRQVGERALAARVLSAAVAVFAVAFQWLGHTDPRQGGFFAGVSALAYVTWLINSADRRRDALRAAGQLPPPAPVYGLIQWVRHPGVTWQARRLALQDPTLGLYGSLAAVVEQRRTETRQRALAALLRRRLAEGKSPLAAEIAVTTYDLDEIARRLAATADYDALAGLLAADIRPAKVAGPGSEPDTAAAVAETVAEVRPAATTAKRAGGQTSRRRSVKAPRGKTASTARKGVGAVAAMRAEYGALVAAGKRPTAADLAQAAETATGKKVGGMAARYLAQWQAPEVLAEAEAALGGRDG